MEYCTQNVSPNQYARHVMSSRRMLLQTTSWEPWITKASFCSLKLLPYEASDLDDVRQWKEEMPHPAAVPMCIGAYRGRSLVIGFTVTPEGHLDDSLCLGVEGCS